MVHAHVLRLQDPDGSVVCNAAFDLSHLQLSSAAHALGEILIERHRGAELETDAVLALRVLSSLADEVGALAAKSGNAQVAMPVARMVTLHDALGEWVLSRRGRGWLREADEDALPVLSGMLGPLADLRAEAVAASLAPPPVETV